MHGVDVSGAERFGDVLGGDPDFVDVVERPHANRSGKCETSQNQSPVEWRPSKKRGPSAGRDDGEHVRVDADQVEVVRVALFRQRSPRVSDISSGTVGESIVASGILPVVERREDLARRLADPALGAQVADHVDARLGSSLRLRRPRPFGRAEARRREELGGYPCVAGPSTCSQSTNAGPLSPVDARGRSGESRRASPRAPSRSG